MVNIISSSFQFCFKGGERFTSFCFICKVVPDAYSPCMQSFFVPRMSSTGEYEDLFYVLTSWTKKVCLCKLLFETQPACLLNVS